MNIAMKIVFFSIALNFAVGIMLTAIPQFEAVGATSGFIYDEEYATYFNNTMSTEITPAEQSGSGLFNSIIDLLSMGWANSIKEVLNRYMFGFIDVIRNVFGGMFVENTALLDTMIFIIKSFLIISYIIVIIQFITGINLQGGQ